jgi:hypothetical protein
LNSIFLLSFISPFLLLLLLLLLWI